MTPRTLLLSFAALAALASPAMARNVTYHLPLKAVFDDPQYASKVGNAVTFAFGDQKVEVAQAIREYVDDERHHFHGKTDQGACQDSMIEALEDLKDHVLRDHGDAIVNVVSYFRAQTFSSQTEYECHAGSNGVFVSLKGTIATLKR